ncbi:MAG: peptidylprolyl isomerase [Acidobacteria bacterium]|nr:peptidylprolyl isomerase [Acidobacteriota bacterium]
MKRKIVLAAAVLLTAFLLFCNKPEKPVAKIGGNWVSFEEWQAYLKSIQFKDFGDEEKLRKSFDGFVKREVAYERAKRKGLLSGKSWEDQIEKIKRSVVVYNFIINKYLNGSAEPSEEEKYEVYKTDNAKRHLWGFGVKGKERATEAAESLRKGEKIETVYEAHKGDFANNSKGYDLGNPKFSEIPPDIQKVFFSGKEGDVVEPIQISQDIFMVVMLKELQLPPKPQSFDQATIRKASALKFNKAMLKANEEYKTTFPDFFEKQTVSELMKKDNPSEQDLNTTVGKVGSKKVKYSEILDTYYNDSQRGANLPRNEETFEKVYNRIVIEERIFLAGEKEGLLKDKKVLAEIWERTHQIGAAKCFQDYVSEAVIKDEDLKAYFEKNRSRFSGQPRFNLRYLISTSPEYLNNAVVMFKNGAKWEEVLRAPGILPETGNGILGWLNQDEITNKISGMQTLISREYLIKIFFVF